MSLLPDKRKTKIRQARSNIVKKLNEQIERSHARFLQTSRQKISKRLQSKGAESLRYGDSNHNPFRVKGLQLLKKQKKILRSGEIL